MFPAEKRLDHGRVPEKTEFAWEAAERDARPPARPQRRRGHPPWRQAQFGPFSAWIGDPVSRWRSVDATEWPGQQGQ